MKAPSVEALSTEVDPRTPRVVLGVPPSDAPSDPPDSLEPEAPSLATRAEVAAAVDVIIPKLPPPPAVDPLDALEALEKLSVPAAPLVEPQEPARVVAASNVDADDEAKPAPSLASTLALGSTSTSVEPDALNTVDTQRSFAPQPLSLPKPVAVVEPVRTETTEEVVERVPSPDPEEVDSKKAGEKVGQEKVAAKVERERVVASIDPDEISVPPIGDVAVEEFFSEGDVSRRLAADAIEGDALTVTDKAKRKADPHVAARRERFARYVKWAVAIAAVVCVAAAGRTAMSPSAPAITSANESAAAAPKAAVPAAAPIGDPPVASAASAASPPVVDPVTPPPAASADLASPAPDAVSGEVTGDAKEEKAKARTLLEKRKLAEAIEAGERAVKLDSSDGEAWLILGAAYQEKGNIADARRAYASCVKEGKTGPRQECAKMLR